MHTMEQCMENLKTICFVNITLGAGLCWFLLLWFFFSSQDFFMFSVIKKYNLLNVVANPQDGIFVFKGFRMLCNLLVKSVSFLVPRSGYILVSFCFHCLFMYWVIAANKLQWIRWFCLWVAIKSKMSHGTNYAIEILNLVRIRIPTFVSSTVSGRVKCCRISLY